MGESPGWRMSADLLSATYGSALFPNAARKNGRVKSTRNKFRLFLINQHYSHASSMSFPRRSKIRRGERQSFIFKKFLVTSSVSYLYNELGSFRHFLTFAINPMVFL